MKFLTILAIFSAAVLTSAAPCHEGHDLNFEHNTNLEDNSNFEDNSHHANKDVTQVVGAVGNSRGNDGLLSGLLGGGILSHTTTNNYITQKAKNDD